MLIKTKYIDCASKSVFNTWKLPTSAADTSGDIYWSAIVYIQDTGEVWTHGKLYGGFFSNADSNKVSLTIGGTTKILALDGHVQSYTTLTGSGTTADQAILSTGVANKWTLKTLGKNAFSNVDYLPADATAVAAEKVVNAMRFQYNGKDMHSFDGSAARLLNIIQGDNVFITGDSQGNVTIATDPGSDTVNTAGATNLIDKKLFLIGAESQTTSPQTYSNQYVYIGTDNCLYSLGKKVLTEHQAIYNLDLQTQVGDAVTKVTTFDPNSANNSFTLVQGINVTLIPDATNKKVTISSKDTTYDFYNLIFKQGDTVVDTYKPTTSPNKSFKAGTNVTFTKSGDEITVTTQDTRNTAGATEKLATKLFLTGSLTQTDNPQTYTNSKVYIGADNKLYSDGKVVSTGDHTHNYAGATTPGGPALKVGLNPSGLLDATYGSYGGILQDSNNGPATGSWSNRIKILHNNSFGYYTELAQAMTGTAGLWHRRNVAGAVSDWTPVIDKANFRTYLDATYVIRGNDPNVLTNYVRYSIASGLTMNWEMGNATPTHIWGAKNSDSSKAYVFNGDNIRAFANAVNRAGDTMTGKLNWSMNGVASSIGSDNGSYTHYNTNASSGHWFNKNVYSAGNFYGGSSYNRILPFKDEINSQVGGSKSAQMLWSSWSTNSQYGGAIQIREYGNVTNNQSAWSYSPAISFHWGNRYARRFGMRSDGQFAVDDVPISLSTHNHNSLYVTALGTNGNYLTWTKNGTANNITVPYATNSDTLDGYHATSFTRRYGINVTTNTTVNVDAYTKSESGTRTAGSMFSVDRWAWASSAYIKLNESYTIDRMRYSIFSYRNGNLTGSWQQQALLFLPTYSDSNAIYLAQMTTSETAGTVSTSIKRYIDYDTTVANITGGNVSSSTNADKLDGYHANGLFTGLSNSGNNISISIGGTTKTLTVGYASSAGSATTATYLPYQDTRSTNYTPYQSGFDTKGWSATHLKQNTTDGLSDGGTYHSSIYVYPWGNSSGGHAHNLAFTDNGNMWMRHGTSSWSSWVKVYTSGNINPVDKTLLKKTRVPGEVIDFYVYRVGNSYATNTNYTTFKNLLFDSSGRGKSSVTYYATYSNQYTVDLSDFVLCSGNMSGYSNGAYMAGAGELETDRVGQSVGANSKTISGLEMPKHAHWFGHRRSDNANDRDVFGPDGGQNHSTNGTTPAGQGGNWRTGYSGSGQSKDWRPRTVFVFKMIYAPKSW